jgi:putative tricarboxylic transport membrane protein
MFRQLKLAAALVGAAALLTTGCGATADRAEPGASAPADEPLAGLRFMVPNTPGSG